MSNLMKNSLLQTNPHLNARVHAAVIQVAREQHSSANTSSSGYANLILKDLNRSWPDFILNAAADTDIQTASVINEDNTAIVTTEVTDDMILTVVNGHWWTAAAKYAPQQPDNGEPS